MLKNILDLEGAQELTSIEQKEINGGRFPAEPICGEVIWSAPEKVCMSYNIEYRPMYLGNNKCSILGDNC